MKLYYVNDGVPAEGTSLLRRAATERSIEFVEIAAPGFSFDERRLPAAGDLLYRPAVSLAAMRVEQFLYHDRVSTFYGDSGGPWFGPTAGVVLYQRAGLSVPRTFPCATADRGVLRAFVKRLGGFPVVVKLMGLSGGLGVMIVDAERELFSLVDYLLNSGQSPLLCAFVADAVHWRVIVIGGSAITAYRNPVDSGDFRTYASGDPADYPAEVPDWIGEFAVRSVETTRYEMGGVDVLEHESGRLYLLEVNFPCYFPQAQLISGTDIAGRMLDHLSRKAGRLGYDCLDG